ncbi:MAG: hypothetical protein Kow0042_00290 [Calditrichia bacterium]
MSNFRFPLMILLLLLIGVSYPQSKGGRWQFEFNGDDTADWDQLNNSGVLQGLASYQPNPLPPEGSASLWLDSAAVHDFFLVNDSYDLDFANENIGISAWIYPLIINDVHYLVNKGLQNSNPKTTNYALRLAPNKKLEFLIRDANNQAQKVTSSFTVPEGSWSFVAAFYDFAAGKVFMWNDPTMPPVDTLDFTQNLIPNNDPLAIGSWFRSDTASPSIKDFEGAMDDVRISERMEDILPPYTALPPESPQESAPSAIALEAFPNPVKRGQHRVQLNIKADHLYNKELRLSIYNLLGQQVWEKTIRSAGPVTPVVWDLRDTGRKLVPAGIYFLRLTQGHSFRGQKKIFVIR